MVDRPNLWEHLCKEAAAKAGISVEELKRKLESDEGAQLEVRFTFDELITHTKESK